MCLQSAVSCVFASFRWNKLCGIINVDMECISKADSGKGLSAVEQSGR